MVYCIITGSDRRSSCSTGACSLTDGHSRAPLLSLLVFFSPLFKTHLSFFESTVSLFQTLTFELATI